MANKPVVLILIAAAAALFGAAALAARQYGLAAAALASAALWLGLEWLEKRRFNNLFLLAEIVLAAVGVISSLAFPLLLAGVCASLAAWDLARFLARMQTAASVEQPGLFQRQHLLRLALVILPAFGMTLLAFTIRLSLSFAVVAGAALLAMAGLWFAVRLLKTLD